VVTVEMPWGEALPLDTPDLFATVFAWVHFQAGHRYRVTGEEGLLRVECECGDTSGEGEDRVHRLVFPPTGLVRREPMPPLIPA
jgi:hypothetical protein